MSAEKYVENIVSKIKCTGEKKKEIKAQLLSDISMRMEQGEALEQIMESMGTAQEIADAFSRDLPDTEKKIRRKKQIGVIIGAVILGVVLFGYYVWWAFPKPTDLVSEEDIADEVETVVELLNRNDFETLQRRAIEQMQNVLTRETIDKAREYIPGDWGEMQSMGSVHAQGYKQKGRLMVVTQVDVFYENVSVVYTITFDENGKLAGLYMR